MQAVIVAAIASVAVAIALIMTIQSEVKPISDVELQKKTEALPEVRRLLLKYPDAGVQFNDDGIKRTIDYFAIVDGNDRYSYMLNLGLIVEQTTGEVQKMTLTCTKSDGINDSLRQQISENIEEAITNDACLRIVSTSEMEAAKLVPSTILTLSHEERAKRIVTAIDPDDKIVMARLNNTRLIAFPTEKGADITVSKVPDYRAVEYSKFNGPVLTSFSDQEAMNFTKRLMEKIGYRMDGSEWVDAVNFGDVIDITIRQQAGGWRISDEGANFRYYQDQASITIERWYDSISSYEFGLSSDDSKPIAKEFMDSEVKRNPMFQKYAYQAHEVLHAGVEIIDDRVTYLVTIGYGTTNPSYYEDRGHCGEPAYQGFDVMVDASTGTAFDWRFSLCE